MLQRNPELYLALRQSDSQKKGHQRIFISLLIWYYAINLSNLVACSYLELIKGLLQYQYIYILHIHIKGGLYRMRLVVVHPSMGI